MLDLLAASYYNIGPLFDKKVSLCFHTGTYLINAPVGTGKSFLFFDGPIFSLYKYAVRPIRNRRSHQAYTQLLFVVGDDVWYIERTLVPTKRGGDSVKSKLSRVTLTKEETISLLTGYDTFFDECIDEVVGDNLEPIIFASEKELDSVLQDMLPPRDVVLNSHFLMQDADNIFELTPVERLELFKHIFGFIGIDHAKEILRDKRKELQTAITIKNDSSDIEHAARESLGNMHIAIQQLQALQPTDTLLQNLLTEGLGQDFFKDIVLLSETIQLAGLSCEVDMHFAEQIHIFIEQEQKTYQQRVMRMEESLLRTEELQQKKGEIAKKIDVLEKEIHTIDQEMKHTDENTIQSIEEKNRIYTDRLQAMLDMYRDRFATHGYAVEAMVDVIRIIDGLIADGKQLTQHLQQQQQLIYTLDQQHISLKEKIHHIDKQYTALTQSYEEQSVFRCDKIDGDCPYVEVIKGASLRALQKQQKDVEENMILYSRELELSQQQLLQAKKEQQDIEQAIEKSRGLLTDLAWKQAQEDYTTYVEIEKKSKALLTSLEQLRHNEKKQQAQQQSLEQKKITKHLLDEQYISLEKEIASLVLDIQTYRAHIDIFPKELYTTVTGLLDSLTTSLQDVQKYIDIYTHRRKEVALLEEEQKKVKHLHTVFSKELLVLVLQDFLPTIQSTMNSYLSTVTDYTLVFELEMTGSDTLHLEIYAEDDKGKRVVKSLSGGQKSLLKLAWIFSIATMLKLPFLFLDETITSLDRSTTSDVADVLYRFAQDFSTKLYIITHSLQIQQMHIWDKEVILSLK